MLLAADTPLKFILLALISELKTLTPEKLKLLPLAIASTSVTVDMLDISVEISPDTEFT